MIIRFTRTVTLPSGNLARNFRFQNLGYGRVQATYEYTDRGRAHQVARRYTVEFLNCHVNYISARSPNGGRIEVFKTSEILAELIEMLSEFLEASQDVAQYRYAPAKVEETETEQDSASEASKLAEDDSTSVEDTTSNTSTDLMNTVRLVGIGVAVSLMVTLATLGIVWYNL